MPVISNEHDRALRPVWYAIITIDNAFAVAGAILALIAFVNSAIKLSNHSQDVIGDYITMVGGMIGAVVLLKFIYLKTKNMTQNQVLIDLKDVCTSTSRSIRELIEKVDEHNSRMDKRFAESDKRFAESEKRFAENCKRQDEILQEIKAIKLNIV